MGLSFLCSLFGSSILCQNIALITRWSFVWMPYDWWVNYKAFFLYLWMGRDSLLFNGNSFVFGHPWDQPWLWSWILHKEEKSPHQQILRFSWGLHLRSSYPVCNCSYEIWGIVLGYSMKQEYGIQEFYAEEFLQSFEVEFKFSAHQWLMRMLFLHRQRAQDEKPKKMSKFSNFICIARPFDCLSFLDLYRFYSWQLNFSLSVIFSLINAIPISRCWMQIGLYRWWASFLCRKHFANFDSSVAPIL